jgi:hypothetical protein
MVARTRTGPIGLVVTFSRDGEPPKTMAARDGASAWRHAVNLLARHDALHAGDRLTVDAAEKEGIDNA